MVQSFLSQSAFSKISIAFVAVLFISAHQNSYIEKKLLCKIENTAIIGGEKLVYKAYYNWEFVWVPAGEAEFHIKETPETYQVTVRAKTYKGYDAFFRVRDYFYSEIDKNTMFPKKFVRHIEEGSYTKFDSMIFYPEKNQAISFNGPTRTKAKRKVITIDPCTHDLLSVFYFLRNTDVNNFKPGEAIPTTMLFDEEIYPIKVRYDSHHKNYNIKDVGKIDAIKVIPDLITGTVFKDGNQMQIFVSNDKNKIPLVVESPLVVGSAKAVLKSYSGLRHKLVIK